MSDVKKAEELKPGEVMIESVRTVKGGKVQIEVAERLASAAINVAALMNKSDDRFSASGIRRAWQSGEKEDIEETFGIKLPEEISDDKENPTLLGIMNPKVLGQPLHVRVVESITPNEYQAENVESTAKKAGANGDFLLKDGNYIFSNTSLVAGEAEHVFIQHDAPEGTGVAATAPETEAHVIGETANG